MDKGFWEFMFEKLTTVPGKDKKFDRAPEREKGTGKAARSAGQVVTQFSVMSFNRIGLTFIGKRRVNTGSIHKRFINREGIRVILMGKWAAVKHGLHILSGAFLDDIPA